MLHTLPCSFTTGIQHWQQIPKQQLTLALGNFGFFVREVHKILLPTDMKYLNVIFKEAIVPNSAKSLQPSNRITASPSSFSFLFIPPLFLHPFCSIPPVSGEPFYTFLLSPFHMEEQLLRVHSVSLCLPLPHLLSSLPLLDPEGITLSEPNVPQTCQMMFVFLPLSRACFFIFFFACVF